MEEAQSQLAAFPVGGDIDVGYRPNNPGAAAVEGGATAVAVRPDGSYRAGVALMFGASFAVAAYALGPFLDASAITDRN